MVYYRIVINPAQQPKEKRRYVKRQNRGQDGIKIETRPGDDNFVNCALCGARIGPNYEEKQAYERKPPAKHIRAVYPESPYLCWQCLTNYC